MFIQAGRRHKWSKPDGASNPLESRVSILILIFLFLVGRIQQPCVYSFLTPKSLSMDNQDAILLRLYRRHFPDPRPALERLNRHLDAISFGFDLKAQVRELPVPCLPNLTMCPDHFQVPSSIYYFVPNTRYGTHRSKNLQRRTEAESYLNEYDGVGLNLGCPVRLLRALDALEGLQGLDRRSPIEELCDPFKHLNAVEELLWITGWREISECRRGGNLPGLEKNVDWFLSTGSDCLFLEAKCRPSDWPNHSDGTAFRHSGKGFLARAVGKFREMPKSSALNVVGITTTGYVTKRVVHMIGAELEKAPQIHAVVIRHYLQQTYFISLDEAKCHRIRNLMTIPVPNDFPSNYNFAYDRKKRDTRIQTRQKQTVQVPESKAFCITLSTNKPLPYLLRDAHAYRAAVLHAESGEPIYRLIPRDADSFDLGDCSPFRIPVRSLIE